MSSACVAVKYEVINADIHWKVKNVEKVGPWVSLGPCGWVRVDFFFFTDIPSFALWGIFKDIPSDGRVSLATGPVTVSFACSVRWTRATWPNQEVSEVANGDIKSVLFVPDSPKCTLWTSLSAGSHCEAGEAFALGGQPEAWPLSSLRPTIHGRWDGFCHEALVCYSVKPSGFPSVF